MAGQIRTEGVVLRTMRYGEADRILHILSPDRGRIGAIAKGARRLHSRFGGRLEPCFRVALVLYEGRGDLLTVTSVDTISPHANLRTRASTLAAAGLACDAVAKLFDTNEGQPAAYNLLCNQLVLLDEAPSQATQANALAFRLKLLLVAGLAPQLSHCAECGETEHLACYSGAAGGVVCAACEANAFSLSEQAYQFMVQALGAPLATGPSCSEQAARQVDRAVRETVEHHGHIRLTSVLTTLKS